MLTRPQVLKFLCVSRVSSTQTCGVESSELRCIGVPSFAGMSHIIRLGFKCLLGWPLRRKLSTFLPAALFCLWHWYELWVLLGSGLVLYVKVPNIPWSLTQQGIALVTAAQLAAEPVMTETTMSAACVPLCQASGKLDVVKWLLPGWGMSRRRESSRADSQESVAPCWAFAARSKGASTHQEVGCPTGRRLLQLCAGELRLCPKLEQEQNAAKGHPAARSTLPCSLLPRCTWKMPYLQLYLRACLSRRHFQRKCSVSLA